MIRKIMALSKKSKERLTFLGALGMSTGVIAIADLLLSATSEDGGDA
jgi:hypothetical protein